MAALRSHCDLKAWQLAFRLGVETYRLTEKFPPSEKFGLTAQIRRAATSIACNIAEGYGRRTRPEYLRFLDIARGSLFEFDTLLRFATELGFADKDSLQNLD